MEDDLPTLGDLLTTEQREALGVKSVEEALDLTVQQRAQAVAAGFPAVWWFARPAEAWDVSPWWRPQRDQELRDFVKREGNDILAGAVSSMVKKFKAMNWTLDGPKSTVAERQEVLSQAEFGGGWGALIGKTVDDYCTCDRGAFWELIGKGDPDKPLRGLPVGVAHLDAAQCHLTGDPEYPVVFLAGKDGRAHKMHATRVVHLVDMESPNAAMLGVGFSAVSRVVASSQILLLLSKYKVEKLDDLPQAGILVLNNVVPQKWEDAKAEHERGRRQLGHEIWSNVMTLIGVDPAQPADAKFVNFAQIPDAFNEQESVTTYVNVVALSFGVDPREFWPVSSGALGTASESLVMAQKAKGKGIGDLISTIERAVNWRLMPKRVEFHFDFQDDEEDIQRAQIEDAKTKTIVSMYAAADPASGETLVTRDEARQMLADNVSYFNPSFLEMDVTGDVVADDVDREAEKAWGPTAVMDRRGEVRLRLARGYKLSNAEGPLDEADAAKQAERATPAGAPLPAWEGEVGFTEDEIAAALAEWDRRVPEARGLLGG